MKDTPLSRDYPALDALRQRISGLQARQDDQLAEMAAADLAGRKRLRRALARLEGQAAGLRDDLAAARQKIADADAAAGDPLGAGAIDPALPLLLLPVRIETRYQRNILSLRVYPDDIHVDTHEPRLTPREAEALSAYGRTLKGGSEADRKAGFLDLVTGFGLRRALYLDRVVDGPDPGRRPDSWSRAPLARALPDRFAAALRLAGSSSFGFHPFPSVVRDPLVVGPDPAARAGGTAAPLGTEAQWITDFAQALRAGMAAEIDLGSDTGSVAELFVLGLCSCSDRDRQAAELAALLEAHRHSGGLDLLAPGTATNTLPGRRSAFDPKGPPPDLVYRTAIERQMQGGRPVRPPPLTSRDRPDPVHGTVRVPDPTRVGVPLATALGLPVHSFGQVPGAGRTWRAVEQHFAALLAGAVRTPLSSLWGDRVGPDLVSLASDLAKTQLSTSGPFPALLVGTAPYGVLPVHLPPPGTDPRHDALGRLRAHILDPAVAASVPLVSRPPAGGAGDPGATLARILARAPAALSLAMRPLVTGAPADRLRQAMPATGRAAADAAATRAKDHLARLGIADPDAVALTGALFLDRSTEITLPMIQPANPRGLEALDAYLRWLQATPAGNILSRMYLPEDTQPFALLFEVIRLAVVEAIRLDSMHMLRDVGIASDSDFEAPAGRLSTLAARLAEPFPAGYLTRLYDMLPPLGETSPQRPWFRPNQMALAARLADLAVLVRSADDKDPVGLCDTLLRSLLGAFTHRADAWASAIATEALDAARGAVPAADRDGRPYARDPETGVALGVTLGAFGWVRDIPRHPGPTSVGFALAPSPAQAVTAGALLSAAAAFRGTSLAEGYAVDLSSRRVRAAVEATRGVRDGATLGSMLGYRLERHLAQAGGTAPALIPRLRALGSGPGHSADHPADGLALLGRYYAPAARRFDWTRVTADLGALDPGQDTALRSAFQALAEAMDATGDLTLAETLHQTLNGSLDRAAAVADATLGTFVPPPAHAVAETLRSGIGVDHRVLILCDGAPARPGWGKTPRALAEPLLDSFLSRILPDPARIAVIATATAPDGVQQTVTTTLAALTLAAGAAAVGRPDLALAPIDLLFDPGAVEALAARARALIAATRADLAGHRITVDPAAPGAGGDSLCLADLAVLADHFARALLPLDPIEPRDLPPGATPLDQEFTARRDALRGLMTQLRQDLGTFDPATASPALREALSFRLAQFGLPQGDPALAQPFDRGALLAELDRRLTRLAAEPAPALALAAAFGGRFPVLTPHEPGARSLPDLWGQELGASPAALQRFVAQRARVRPRLALVDTALQLAAAADPAALATRLLVRQTPSGAGERWVGLPEPPVPGRTGLVAITAVPDSGGPAGAVAAVGGLVVDHWAETVPQPTADLAIAAHLESAASAAPNCLLLCAPDPGGAAWTSDRVLALIREAFALARTRALLPEDLPDLAQVLPALIAEGAIGLPDGSQVSLLDAMTATRPEPP